MTFLFLEDKEVERVEFQELPLNRGLLKSDVLNSESSLFGARARPWNCVYSSDYLAGF
jgi:hypothetical protein